MLGAAEIVTSDVTGRALDSLVILMLLLREYCSDSSDEVVDGEVRC
jgi:hypothetical protein